MTSVVAVVPGCVTSGWLVDGSIVVTPMPGGLVVADWLVSGPASSVTSVVAVVAGRVTSGWLVDGSVVTVVTRGLVVADWLVSGCGLFPTVGATGPVSGPGLTCPCVSLPSLILHIEAITASTHIIAKCDAIATYSHCHQPYM